MPADCFHTLSLSQFGKSLEELHHRVAAGHGRVEVKSEAGHHACILISKSELESLERALEILSGTGDYQSMCNTIQTLASQCAASPVTQTA